MESPEIKTLRTILVMCQQKFDAAKAELEAIQKTIATFEKSTGKAARTSTPKAAQTKKARVPRIDQSGEVIAILKKAGKPMSKQEIGKALGKAFKPNSWILTIAKAKKNGVKQKGDKAQATYSM